MKKTLLSVSAILLFLTSCDRENDVSENSTPNSSIRPISMQTSVVFPATGTANSIYAQNGPYQVSTDAVVGDCSSLGGVIVDILQSINVLDQSIQCTNNIPFGNGSPITTSVYYPSNIQNLGKLPVVNFVGGILSNEGNYYQMIKLWASHGFVVVISSDFINSFPTMHLLGAVNVAKLNKDPQSPLYGKVDLSKMIVAGHSAGGGASILTSSIPDNALKLIDTQLKIIGSLPIEPGPVAIGSTVKSPTFILTGGLDYVVPAWAWPQLWQGNLIKDVPAWTATATTATHFSPTMQISHNEFAGISVAWLKYIGYNDILAKSFFVGSGYKLKQDPQFIQSIINPLRVNRNAVADQLQ